MANFDPAKALLRVFYQTAEGLIPLTGGRDMQINSEGFASTPGIVERTAISPVALAALQGKTTNAPTEGIDAINPDDPGIAVLFPLDYVTTSSPVAGVYYHDISNVAGDDDMPGYIAVKVWRDGLVGHRFLDWLVTGSTISFGENALVSCALSGVASYGDYWDDGVHTAGAGTGAMRLRGIIGEEIKLSETVVVEVVTTAPLVVKAKRGSAAGYSANQPQTLALWGRLNDEDDVLFGTLASPLEILITGAVAIGDIYTFGAIEAPWVPTLPDPDHVVSEVYSSVLVDGAPFVLKSGSLALNRPAVPVQGFGGVRNAGTRRQGTLTPVLSFTRDTLSELVRFGLETSEPFDFTLNLYSPVKIAATAFHYGIEITMTGLRMSGPTPTVPSGTALQQDSVTTTGGTLAIRVINSQASII